MASWISSLARSTNRPHDRVADRHAAKGTLSARCPGTRLPSYIHGFAQRQQTPAYTTPEEATGRRASSQVPATDYLHLAELLFEHAITPAYDYAAPFDFGLELILSGLQRLAVMSRHVGRDCVTTRSESMDG